MDTVAPWGTQTSVGARTLNEVNGHTEDGDRTILCVEAPRREAKKVIQLIDGMIAGGRATSLLRPPAYEYSQTQF